LIFSSRRLHALAVSNSSIMSLPDAMLNPDDPAYVGKTWEAVERALDFRDAILTSASGNGYIPEPRGPTAQDPSRPQLSTFPWEEHVDPFDKLASCKIGNWKHEKCLKVSLGKQTATLQFNKAATNNMIDPAMLDAFQDAIMDLQERPEIRVVILKSEGKLFSNGFDPSYLISESKMSSEEVNAVHLQFAKILYYWQKLPQLTVALIQGSAMGAAMGLVCACDMVYAVKGAYFAMNEAKLGAVATTSIPYILRKLTFFKDSYLLLLAGMSLSADTAKEYGIVTEVVEDVAGLQAECKALCDKMSVCAPGAVAASKELVSNTCGAPPSSFMLDYVSSVLGDVGQSPEAKAGLDAMASKKKPPWAEAPVVPAA